MMKNKENILSKENSCIKNCEYCDGFDMECKQEPISKNEQGIFTFPDNQIKYACQILGTEVSFKSRNCNFNAIESEKLY